jgi:hypothetical protein
LFPWPEYWDYSDELLDKLLASGIHTSFTRGAIQARLGEYDMVLLHHRWEAVGFETKQVLKGAAACLSAYFGCLQSQRLLFSLVEFFST